MRSTFLIKATCGLMLALCAGGCQMFRPQPDTHDMPIAAPGALDSSEGRAFDDELAHPAPEPLVFGAGDTLGRALYRQYVVFVRVQRTPRIQLTEVPVVVNERAGSTIADRP